MTKVDDLLAASVSSGQVLGLAAMSVARGRATYSGAFGTRSSVNSSLMTVDTVFEGSALLRPVMAVAALQTGRRRAAGAGRAAAHRAAGAGRAERA